MWKEYFLVAANLASVASCIPYTQILLRNKGYSHSVVGVIIALGQAFSIIGPILISVWTDKTRKTKPFLILCGVASILIALPYFLSKNIISVLVSACLFEALYGSINPLCDGFLNRKVKDESYKYSRIRAVGTIGYMLALIFFALSGFPDEKNNTSIYLCFVAVMVLFIVSAFLEKDDTRETVGEKKKGEVFSFSWFPPGFYFFMGIVAITRIGQSVVEKLLSSYMTEILNLGGNFTLFYAAGALCEFFCMIFFGNLLKKKTVTPYSLLIISSVALTIRLLLYLIPNIFVFTFAQCLNGLTFGALHIAVSAYLTETVSSNHYEVGMTIYHAGATNASLMLGAFCGGYIIEKWGYSVLFSSYVSFPILGILMAVVFRKQICKKYNK